MRKTTTKRATDENYKRFVEADAAWERGDLRRAFELFSQGAEAGDDSCWLNLGHFFDKGLYVKKDKKRAMYWYSRAYRQGEVGAANNIAILHRENRDLNKMIWWFRRAIALGDHDAWWDIGKCYETGAGLPKSPRKAALCYRRILASEHVTEFTWERAKRRLAKLVRDEGR